MRKGLVLMVVLLSTFISAKERVWGKGVVYDDAISKCEHGVPDGWTQCFSWLLVQQEGTLLYFRGDKKLTTVFHKGDTIMFRRKADFPGKIETYPRIADYAVQDIRGKQYKLSLISTEERKEAGRTESQAKQSVLSTEADSMLGASGSASVSPHISNHTTAPASAPRINPPQLSSGSVTPEARKSYQVKETSASVPSSGTLGVTGADWEQGGVRGVEVVDVFDNGSAQLAGLHKGDVITDVNGKTVRSIQDLTSVLGQIELGGKVSIGYIIKTQLGWMPKETSAILAREN